MDPFEDPCGNDFVHFSGMFFPEEASPAPSKRSHKRKPTKFRWTQRDGRIVAPFEMDTEHLLNTIKMLYNHNVLPRYQLHPFHYWPDIARLPYDYTRRAIVALCAEIKKRKLTIKQKVVLHHMRARLAQYQNTKG